MKPLIPYESRAAAMNKKAAQKEKQIINELLEKFEASCKDAGNSTIDAANYSREIGIHFITLTGHEQISFEFWSINCAGEIKCSFEQAKRHVSVAHKMPQKAKTISEAAPFIQMCFATAGLVEIPERTELQISSPTGPMQKFFFEVTSIRKDFEKAVRQVPMDNWSPPILRSFLKDTEWLRQESEKAQKLLEGKK